MLLGREKAEQMRNEVLVSETGKHKSACKTERESILSWSLKVFEELYTEMTSTTRTLTYHTLVGVCCDTFT